MEKQNYSKKPMNTFDQENRIGYFQKDENRESIYIGNLSYKLDKIGISKIFTPFGKVRYVKIVVEPKNNRSKGIAFVQLSNKKETKTAIEALNGTLIDGRTVKVSLANNQDSFDGTKKNFNKGFKNTTNSSDTEEPEIKMGPRRRDKKRGLNTLFNYLHAPKSTK
jgi:RNA recognition motif-containing protein